MSVKRLAPQKSFGLSLRDFSSRNFRVSDTRLGADLTLPRHAHGSAYLCIVLVGAYREDWRREHDCRRGSVLIHAAATSHSNRIGPHGARCVNIECAPAQEGEFSGLFDRSRHLRLPSSSSELIGLSEALAGETLEAVDEAVLKLLGLCLNLPSDPGSPRWLAKVLAAVEADLAHAHSLEELAKSVSLHPHHLARAFHEARNETLGAYLTRRRLEWADQALTRGHEALADIALRCGFCDQAHFTRAYRRHFGLSPGQRRRQAGN